MNNKFQGMISVLIIVNFIFMFNETAFSKEYPQIKKIVLGKFKSEEGEMSAVGLKPAR